MSDMTPRIHDVHYNAAEQCFEALVTLHTPAGRVRVASQFPAPLTTEFETASRGLLNAALLAISDRTALKSRQIRQPLVPSSAVCAAVSARRGAADAPAFAAMTEGRAAPTGHMPHAA